MKSRHFILLSAALLMSACRGAPEGPISFPLAWSGVDNSVIVAPEVTAAFGKHPFVLTVVKDTRANKATVGLTKDTNQPVLTNTDVSQFCTAQFRDTLKGAGANLLQAGDLRVNSELQTFTVEEGGSYVAKVILKVSVQRSGVETWSAIFSGQSNRWGRSFSPDNYNEALSNALAQAFRNVLLSKEFATALQ
jgi:hypothetical protein